MRLFFQSDEAVFNSAARPASSSGSAVRKFTKSRVFLVIGVSMWTMCDLLFKQIADAGSRIITATHQPQMRRINTGTVSTNMVNSGFIVSKWFSGIRNISNEQFIRDTVSFQLPLLVHSKSLNNDAVSESVFGCNPNPASGLFVQLNHFSEAVQQWPWFFPDHNGGNKKPTRSLEVKSAHDEPQPASELEKHISCFVPLQGNASVNHFSGGVNAIA